MEGFIHQCLMTKECSALKAEANRTLSTCHSSCYPYHLLTVCHTECNYSIDTLLGLLALQEPEFKQNDNFSEPWV